MEKDEKKSEIIKKKVKEIIRENLASFNSEESNNDITLENYSINSIDALEMLILVENEFGIEVSDEDLNAELFMDLDRLTDYILNLVSDDYFSE